MPIDYEAAERERDRRRRGKLLMVLFETARNSPTGFMDGPSVMSFADTCLDQGDRFDGDEERAMELLRDLRLCGFAEERPNGHRRKGQRFTLAFLRFGITQDGIKLHLQQLPPHPLIEDGRVVEER